MPYGMTVFICRRLYPSQIKLALDLLTPEVIEDVLPIPVLAGLDVHL